MNHRYLYLVLAVFVLIHDPNGDRVVSYTGVDPQAIAPLIPYPFAFIDQATYNAFLAAHTLTPPTTTQMQLTIRAKASTLALQGIDANAELTRAALLAILDQLNVIRAALPTPLAPITPAQAKNAIQAKINAGAAD